MKIDCPVTVGFILTMSLRGVILTCVELLTFCLLDGSHLHLFHMVIFQMSCSEVMLTKVYYISVFNGRGH